VASGSCWAGAVFTRGRGRRPGSILALPTTSQWQIRDLNNPVPAAAPAEARAQAARAITSDPRPRITSRRQYTGSVRRPPKAEKVGASSAA
jgi:hypothetical protein